jgi:hypothetical protein
MVASCVHLIWRLSDNRQNHEMLVNSLLQNLIELFSNLIPTDQQIREYSEYKNNDGQVKYIMSDKNLMAFHLMVNIAHNLTSNPNFSTALLSEGILSRLLSAKFYLGTLDTENELKCKVHSLFDVFFGCVDPEGVLENIEVINFLRLSFDHLASEPNLKAANSLVRAVFRSMSRYRSNSMFKVEFLKIPNCESKFVRMVKECSD